MAEVIGEFFTNIWNKSLYNIHMFAYDPEADKFAKEAADRLAAEAAKAEGVPVTPVDPPPVDPATLPHKFNWGHVISKTLTKTMKFMIPFIAIVLAVIVSNDMIVYPIPIRIIFFIVTLVVTMFNPMALISVLLYYIIKALKINSENNDALKKDPKAKIKKLFPTIFAALPIKVTVEGLPLWKSIPLGLFIYRPDKPEDKLDEIKQTHWNNLINSVKCYKPSELSGTEASIDIAKEKFASYDNMQLVLNDVISPDNCIASTVTPASTNPASSTPNPATTNPAASSGSSALTGASGASGNPVTPITSANPASTSASSTASSTASTSASALPLTSASASLTSTSASLTSGAVTSVIPSAVTSGAVIPSPLAAGPLAAGPLAAGPLAAGAAGAASAKTNPNRIIDPSIPVQRGGPGNNPGTAMGYTL